MLSGRGREKSQVANTDRKERLMNWLEVLSTIVGSGVLAQLISIIDKRRQSNSISSKLTEYGNLIADLEKLEIGSDSYAGRGARVIARRATAKSLAREFISDNTVGYWILCILSLIVGVIGVFAAEAGAGVVGWFMVLPFVASVFIVTIVSPTENRVRNLLEETLLPAISGSASGAEEVQSGNVENLKRVLEGKKAKISLGPHLLRSLKEAYGF